MKGVFHFSEAVNHFADALDLQKGGAKEQSAIWGPLRSSGQFLTERRLVKVPSHYTRHPSIISAVRCLAHAPQLLPFVDQRDLVGLKRALSTLPPSDRSI